jgi:hypothetical protein
MWQLYAGFYYRQQIPSKLSYLPSNLHGFTSQKTNFVTYSVTNPYLLSMSLRKKNFAVFTSITQYFTADKKCDAVLSGRGTGAGKR